MKGFRWLGIFVLLLSLACTRELDPYGCGGDSALSFSFEEAVVQGLVETKAPSGSVKTLISDDGINAFVLAEDMGPMADIPTRASAYSAVSDISSFNVTAFDHTGNFGASTVTTDNGKGFVDQTFSVTHSGSDYWGVPSPARYWPTSERKMSFFACAPADAVSIQQGAGYPSFTYNVPDDIASQKDLLIASTLNQVNTVSSQGAPGRAPLTFRHALSALVFTIGDMGVNSSSGSLTVTLKGLRNQRRFTFSEASSTSSLGGSWNNAVQGSGTYTFTTNLNNADYSTISGNKVLFVMPQTIPSDAELNISYTDPEGTVHLFSVQLNTLGITSMTAGGVYKYTISLSNKPANLQVAYQKWTKSGSTDKVDGPVTQYESGESFGVYAVDANNRVVFANAKMTASSSAATTALNSGNYFLSSTYTYYIYYPYKANLHITYNDVALEAGSVLPDLPTASDFFERYISGKYLIGTTNYTTGFTPATDQTTLAKLKAQDLQVGMVTGSTGTVTANMAHQMSLAKIIMQSASVPDKVYNGKAGTTTNTNVSMRPGAFNTSSPNARPYQVGSSDNYYYIAKYNAKPWVSEASDVAEYEHWETSPVVIQSSTGTALGAGYYREFTITSRAAARGFRTFVAEYDYKGSVMTFTPPANGTGIYKFECWGASGGGNQGTYGRGGYTGGNMYVPTGTTYYVYVGQYGGTARTSRGKSWNGGGEGSDEGNYTNRGGGATDFRYVNGAWNNANSLASRFMVAGGGGGGSHHGDGGHGGGFVGGNGHPWGDLTGPTTCIGKGGTQTAGGAKGAGHTWGDPKPEDGSLGTGGGGNHYGGGGGGGYYGGGGAAVTGGAMTGGGGGSSYIAGYTYGNNSCPGLSHYGFTNASMIAGNASMTEPDGSTSVGHVGNGYARITFVGPM